MGVIFIVGFLVLKEYWGIFLNSITHDVRFKPSWYLKSLFLLMLFFFMWSKI
jgi:hypothetical protein